MNPYDFQNLVAALLTAMVYRVSWVPPPGRTRLCNARGERWAENYSCGRSCGRM